MDEGSFKKKKKKKDEVEPPCSIKKSKDLMPVWQDIENSMAHRNLFWRCDRGFGKVSTTKITDKADLLQLLTL